MIRGPSGVGMNTTDASTFREISDLGLLGFEACLARSELSDAGFRHDRKVAASQPLGSAADI